jgi:hypothetical protein
VGGLGEVYTCPYTSQGYQSILSSLHMGYIPHVVMPVFKISSRSYGPSWKRGRGSHTNNYLIKDQVAPEHIWGLIHQGTKPRINPCLRHGYPGTHPGALDISRDLNCLVPDQEPQSYTGGPLKGLYCLVPDQEPQSYTGGPLKGLLPWL